MRKITALILVLILTFPAIALQTGTYLHLVPVNESGSFAAAGRMLKAYSSTSGFQFQVAGELVVSGTATANVLETTGDLMVGGSISAATLMADYSHVTGTLTAGTIIAEEGALIAGVNDTIGGIVSAHGAGPGSTTGGRIVLGLAADHDGVNNELSLALSSADFTIGWNTDLDRIKLSEAGHLTLTAGNFGIGSLIPSASLSIGDDLATAAYDIMVGDLDGDTGIQLGQSSSRFGGLRWDYNATPGNAYLALETNSYLNPLYLDGSAMYLQMLQDGVVYAGSDFYIGHNAANDDDILGFDLGGEYLKWANAAGEFQLSDDLNITGGVTTSGDADINGELYGAVIAVPFYFTGVMGSSGQIFGPGGFASSSNTGYSQDRQGSLVGYSYNALTITVNDNIAIGINVDGNELFSFNPSDTNGYSSLTKGVYGFAAGSVISIYGSIGSGDSIANVNIILFLTRD